MTQRKYIVWPYQRLYSGLTVIEMLRSEAHGFKVLVVQKPRMETNHLDVVVCKIMGKELEQQRPGEL